MKSEWQEAYEAGNAAERESEWEKAAKHYERARRAARTVGEERLAARGEARVMAGEGW